MDFNLCFTVGHGHTTRFPRYIRPRTTTSGKGFNSHVFQLYLSIRKERQAHKFQRKKESIQIQYIGPSVVTIIIIPIWHSLSRYRGDILATRTAQASQANLVLSQLFWATPKTLLEQRSANWRKV